MSDVSSDRRAPGASRIKYEALVEVGGAQGPSFEAQAIDLSEGGMHLRTQYLPEEGQPLTCRFDMAEGPPILAAGEVAWVDDANGEFGLKFTGLDQEAIEALERVCGPDAGAGARDHDMESDMRGNDDGGEDKGDGRIDDEPTFADGARVRLHIEGLGAPMRARVRHADQNEMIACSDLAFLQLGRHVDLEHADRGDKHGAEIRGVDVEMDRDGQMPQLVVKLRYAGAEAMNPAGASTAIDRGGDHDPHDVTGGPLAKEKAAMEVASIQAGRALDAAKAGFAKLGPAMVGAFGQARQKVASLRAQKAAASGAAEGTNVPLRKTAAAPGGGLHTQGRKVVRGAAEDSAKTISDVAGKSGARGQMNDVDWNGNSGKLAQLAQAAQLSNLKTHSSKIAAGGVLVVATVLALVALHKPAPTAPLASTDITATQNAAGSAVDAANAANANGTTLTTTAAQGTTPTVPMPPATGAGITPTAPMAANGSPSDFGTASPSEVAPEDPSDQAEEHTSAHARPHHVEPFGNGPVAHGNIIRLKMDGPIEKIEGGVTPNGFSVVIPGRKSLDAAGPLASRDERIGSIKMSNNGDSSELNVAFRDGVPNYQVRAHGSVLEIALAPLGALAPTTAKHGSHERQHVAGDKPTRKKHHAH